jgi:hypothetical protein
MGVRPTAKGRRNDSASGSSKEDVKLHLGSENEITSL